MPVARIERGSIASTTVLTAEFQPFQEVDVMAKVAGYVRTIHVDLGDRVREGQVLAELEVPEMTNEVSKATAIVDETESGIAASRDELQRAESAHQIAHVSYTRLQEVAKREAGLIPQQELDESHSRDLIAEAQLASAKSKLRVEQNKTVVAKAEEARLRTMRNYITITAPFAGTVTKRYANCRLHDPGWNRLAVTSHAAGAAIAGRNPSPESAGTRIARVHHSRRRARRSACEIARPQFRGTGGALRRQGGHGHANHDYRGGCRQPHGRHHARNVRRSIASGRTPRAHFDRAVGRPRTQRNHLPASSRSATRGVVRIVPVQLGVEDSRRAEIVSGLGESDLIITGRRTGLNAGDKVKPKLLESDR